MTFEYLMESVLSRVDDELDKRQGSIIYDAVAPCCKEIEMIYKALDNVINQAFADTADREYLIKRAKERGLQPRDATHALIMAEMDIEVEIGARFNLETVNYSVESLLSIDNGRYIYRLKCETAGEEGNQTGALSPIENISGLGYSVATEILSYGQDIEDTESFRQRYFESLDTYAFGGNIADYKKKGMEIDGVGGIRVCTATELNRGGEVELIIQGADFGVPSEDLISRVQEVFDPKSGSGLGLAPIGHSVTVKGVKSESVHIAAAVYYKNGYSSANIFNKAKSLIQEYFDGLNSQWAERDYITVQRANVWYILSNIEGIDEVAEVYINGNKRNQDFDSDVIVEVGEIIV